MTLKLLHLTKKYGQQFALNDVSFTLKQGEIVGLLGPNGAGKSTLFKLITAYLPATSGEVLVNNLKASEQPLEVKKIIGYLPENNPLYPEMYVKEYLGFIANLHKVSKTNIDKVIAQVGLEGEAPKKISQLSKGYKQRVGLASALIHNPSVLLLDEPTTGLDPNQIIEIRNLIKQIGQTKTVLFSSHILQEVEAICQRVLLINNGKLVADINLNDLKLASTALITLRFDKAVLAANLQSELQPKTIEKTGETSWLLSFENGVDSGAILFDFAKKHGLKIVEMTQKGADLESLFKQFTT
ncbi:MAG: gliding motility-associated ABC transporter ATP-binding subunit GldA [Flavobacteriales bacterium CG03_land_8_20_14_0_80_35_15]|nr:MAG: gliding motility-associated ABC transporter ATP-binding subunit GldA [Flavobacteriales bacterium CG03_land_8_20_14_0_80_35_15]